jgi:hypothetical protein
MSASVPTETRDRLSVCLALIHNNNEERNSRIRPALAELASALGFACNVQLIEVAYQAQLRPHSTRLAFIRDVMYQVLAYQWKKYRRLPVSVYRETMDAFRFLRKKYLGGDRNIIDRWRRSSAIETIVSDKHIRAWDAFLESDCDIVICFEDDAVFNADSIDKLKMVLQEVSALSAATNLYVDLAGGCALSDLFIAQLVQKRSGIFTYYNKAVTNTACAYLLSRSLVAAFREVLTIKPALRLIGIDWMMNRLLIELEAQGASCVCFHTEPTALTHGSVAGDFAAWER